MSPSLNNNAVITGDKSNIISKTNDIGPGLYQESQEINKSKIEVSPTKIFIGKNDNNYNNKKDAEKKNEADKQSDKTFKTK